MARLKYVIYVPILCALAALLWLIFTYITGCLFSGSVASMQIFEREIKKNEILIQKHLQSLKTREDRHNNLLAEIENMAKIVQQQIKFGRTFINGSPIIYGVTPTYTRPTQKADLTRLCQTFLHVSNFHWIVVEDADSKRNVVERLLNRCGLKYTHLAIQTGALYAQGSKDPRWLKPRGVEQRNFGLKWLRDNIDTKTAGGVVYFIDDDNTYDLEIFEQIRHTKKVSVWPVGLAGGLRWEGPVCENGRVVKFHAMWDLTRLFPMDMAGFAINLKLFFDNPTAVIDINAPRGHLESSLLKLLVKRDELEPLADNCKKILVWHTQTAEPKLNQEKRLMAMGKRSDPTLEL